MFRLSPAALFGFASIAALSVAGCTTTGSDRDKFVVFFTTGSTQLESAAANTVAAAAADARTKHSSSIEVEGYAAAHGNLSADEMLAMQRAKLVADTLRQDGVGSAVIHQTAHAPKNDAEAAVAARRVMIDVDP